MKLEIIFGPGTNYIQQALKMHRILGFFEWSLENVLYDMMPCSSYLFKGSEICAGMMYCAITRTKQKDKGIRVTPKCKLSVSSLILDPLINEE